MYQYSSIREPNCILPAWIEEDKEPPKLQNHTVEHCAWLYQACIQAGASCLDRGWLVDSISWMQTKSPLKSLIPLMAVVQQNQVKSVAGDRLLN